jgi:hypothetical protein
VIETSQQQKKSSITTTPQSTISRLESKYSDILDRVAKRKQRQQQEQREAEDRDKTLEPEYTHSTRSSGLMKSQTTANIMSKTSNSNQQSSQKERTPFRLERNKNKYISSEVNDSSVKLKRSDIIGVSGSNSSSDSYTKMKSNDSGYYDSYKTSNYGKSMYDPDILMSDFSTRNSKKTPQPYTGSSTSRQIRPYKRTESGNIDKRRTTVVNLHDMLSDEDSEIENRNNQRKQNLYTQRKSSGQFQMLSDSRQKTTTYKRGEVEEPVSSSSDLDEFDKTERENRRKEIQNLIKKYAQMDDFYGRSTAYSNAELDSSSSDTNCHDSNSSSSSSSNYSSRTSIKKESKSRIDPWDLKNKISPVRIPQKKSMNPLGKSQTMANMSSLSSSHYNDDNNNGYSSWYMSNYHTNHSNNVVPIKTNVARSSTKSRMSKALSTFVRI